MSTRAIFWAIWSSLFCAVGEAQTIDLYFPAPTQRPMLVTVESLLDGSIAVESGNFDWSDDFEYTSEIIFIDEHLELAKDVEKATRHYIRHKALRNKEVADSPLNGVKATYEYLKDDKEWAVQLADQRALTGGLFDQLLAHTVSLGVWVGFPEKVAVGSKFDLDLGLLTPLVIDADGNYKSAGAMRLESHDLATGVAKLKGTATFAGDRIIDETRMRLESKGAIEMDLQLRDQHIAAIRYEGKLVFKQARGREKVSGKADHTFTIATSVKSERIEQYRKRKPRFRIRRVRAPKLGVGVKLPSYWTRIEAADESRVFVRTVEHDKGGATIDMKFIGGDASYQPGGYLDQIYVSLKQDYPTLVQKKTKNPLGRQEGRVYYIPKGKGSGDLIQAEVYPFKGRFFMFRLTSKPKAYPAALKEFKNAKKTLGRLTGKKR
ncbi:MAG: hypothetical protein AAF581_07620 [Planctomycetota bacterium]